MKKNTVRGLTNIRNIIIAGTMFGGLIVWFTLPAVVKNSSIIHVGNGQFGTKIGALVVLLFPLFALIPNINHEEVHTDDPAEREAVYEERLKKDRKMQIAVAVLELLIIALVYTLWILNAA